MVILSITNMQLITSQYVNFISNFYLRLSEKCSPVLKKQAILLLKWPEGEYASYLGELFF